MRKYIIIASLLIIFVIGCYLLFKKPNMSGIYVYFSEEKQVVYSFQLTDNDGNLTGYFNQSWINPQDNSKIESKSFSTEGQYKDSKLLFNINNASNPITGTYKKGELWIVFPYSIEVIDHTMLFKRTDKNNYDKDLDRLYVIADKNLKKKIKLQKESMKYYVEKINQNITSLENQFSIPTNTIENARKDLEILQNDYNQLQKSRDELVKELNNGSIDAATAKTKAAYIKSLSNHIDSNFYTILDANNQVTADINTVQQSYNNLMTDYENYKKLKLELPDYSPSKTINEKTILDLQSKFRRIVDDSMYQNYSFTEQGDLLRKQARIFSDDISAKVNNLK